MNFKLLTLGVTLLSLLSLGCNIKSLEYKNYNSLRVQKVGFSSSTLTMNVVYHNPNNFGLKLNQIDLDVYVNDNYLGHTTQSFQINIPKRGDFSVPIKLELDMKNLLKNAINGLMNQEVTLKTSGSIRVGTGKIYKTFPFVYSTKEKFKLF
jgi:LEA14-like dessication related protein